MTRKFRLPLLFTLAIAGMLSLQSCKDSPLSPNDPPIVGTWRQVSVNGQDVTIQNIVWTFAKDKFTYHDPAGECNSELSYVTVGDKLISTTVNDGCFGSGAGEKDTVTYSISGDQMTIRNSEGKVTVLKKGAPDPNSIVGMWKTTSVDGQGPQPGFRMVLAFNTNTFVVHKDFPDGSTCEITFSYTISNGKLNVQVVGDNCNELQIGTTDLISYTISNGTVSMTFGDGTKLVAARL